MTEKNKGQTSNPKRYRSKMTRTKTQVLELEAETNFKVQCSDLDRYIFHLGPIASKAFARTMKDI